MKLTLAHDFSLPTGIMGMALNASCTHGYAACVDGSICAVDLATGKLEVFDQKHTSYASGCVLLPDGRTLITGGYDGMLLWHDLETRLCIKRVQAHSFWNWQLALSPDGRWLVTTTGQYLSGGWKYEPAVESEPSVKVFDTGNGTQVASFKHTPPVLSCAFAPDNEHLAAGNMLGEVNVWRLGDGSRAAPVSQWKSADFTSWGTTKSHHYCGGIYALAFSLDGESLVGCGMGPMGDPMAGNGKMTWQRWNWRKGERLDQIKDGQHGSGLMETLTWHPNGDHFVMAGRQAQGTWNAAIFSAKDGSLLHSIDTKKRITVARFSADGKLLIVAGAKGQPQRKGGEWPAWGKLQVYRTEA